MGILCPAFHPQRLGYARERHVPRFVFRNATSWQRSAVVRDAIGAFMRYGECYHMLKQAFADGLGLRFGSIMLPVVPCKMRRINSDSHWSSVWCSWFVRLSSRYVG